MPRLTVMVAAALAGLVAIPGPVGACQLEIGSSVYAVSPLVDDGLSNAERVACPHGTLLGYGENVGYVEMLDGSGRHLRVRDLAGTVSGPHEFTVIITENYYVGMRFGTSEVPTYFGEGPSHNGWIAVDAQGAALQAENIASVRTTGDGSIHVELLASDGMICAIQSTPQLFFGSDWICGYG